MSESLNENVIDSESVNDNENVNENMNDNANVDVNDSQSEVHLDPDEQDKPEDRFIVRQVTRRTRFVATVPATGLLIASIVLAIGTFVGLIVSTYEFIVGDIELHALAIEFVEDADLFLLAVALYLLSIGLVSLFISEQIMLPKWLEFHDFDDLKERMTGVIIVMIGVYFLGFVLKGNHGIDTLWIGLGCAAMVIALSFFIRTVFKSEE